MSAHNKIIIAIDGYSSCGKSTLAKDLASHLEYIYIDSGAMYRAVCLYCIKNDIDINNKEDVIKSLDSIKIDFENINGKNTTFLNGENVENMIRSLAVSTIVSEVSTIHEVRKKLVAYQKFMGQNKGIVMDGRDITSVVFPNAEMKLFITSDVEVRVERRYQELLEKGQSVSKEEVRKNLIHRDRIDTTREYSPLIKLDEALLIDNTYLTREEQLQVALRYMQYIITST